MSIVRKLYAGRIGGLAFLVGVLLSNLIFVFQGKIINSVPNGAISSILSILVSVIVFIFFFSVNVRRWHDLGKSGWFSLLVIIPLVNLITGIILIFKPGSREANKYGNPPRSYNYLLQDLFALS